MDKWQIEVSRKYVLEKNRPNNDNLKNGLI